MAQQPTQYFDPDSGEPVVAPAPAAGQATQQYFDPDSGEPIAAPAPKQEPGFLHDYIFGGSGKPSVVGGLKNLASDAVSGITALPGAAMGAVQATGEVLGDFASGGQTGGTLRVASGIMHGAKDHLSNYWGSHSGVGGAYNPLNWKALDFAYEHPGQFALDAATVVEAGAALGAKAPGLSTVRNKAVPVVERGLSKAAPSLPGSKLRKASKASKLATAEEEAAAAAAERASNPATYRNSLPVPPEPMREVAEAHKYELARRGGIERDAAKAEWDDVLSGPLGDVEVTPPKLSEPPPVADLDELTARRFAEDAPEAVEPPRTIRDLHEEKTNLPRQEKFVPTKRSKLVADERNALEADMQAAAEAVGEDFSPYLDAQQSWLDYKETFDRGPAKAVRQIPAVTSVTKFARNPVAWATGQAKRVRYEKGMLPMTREPLEQLREWRKAAPITWEKYRHHVESELINDAIKDGVVDDAFINKQLHTYDQHGVTDEMLPNAAEVRRLTQESAAAKQAYAAAKDKAQAARQLEIRQREIQRKWKKMMAGSAAILGLGWMRNKYTALADVLLPGY